MSGHEVTPEFYFLFFFIKANHRYIHGGRDSYPSVCSCSNSPYFLFTLFYTDLTDPKD